MEQFVELMLATDRKAREMIDKARQAKALDEEFLRAKHALDGRFDANRDAWLDGLCQRMFEA